MSENPLHINNMKKPHAKVCGAKTRSGGVCQSKPMENGRCRMHGGSTPKGADSPNFITGRYSKVLKGNIAQKVELVDDTNPLELASELQIQRAIMAEYVSRFDENVKLTAIDIDMLMGWLDAIGKMVDRIVKMQNNSALTGAEVKFLQARIVDTVLRFVDDADRQRQFIAELFGIAGDGIRHPELAESETAAG